MNRVTRGAIHVILGSLVFYKLCESVIKTFDSIMFFCQEKSIIKQNILF